MRAPTPQQIRQVLPGQWRAVFEQSDKIYLYSLDPSWETNLKNKFHGWGIIGRTPLKDTKTKKQIIAHFYDGIADKQFSAACFNPSHGIRAIKGKKTVDLVICFGCLQVKTFTNGQPIYKGGGSHIGMEPQPMFDHILTRHNIPLTPRQ